MDKRQLTIAIALIVVLMAIYYTTMYYVDRRHPEWAQQISKPLPDDNATKSATEPAPAATTGPATSGPTTGATTTGTAQGMTAGVGLHAAESSNPASSSIGSAQEKDHQYAMQVAIAPEGAGLTKVTLNQFRQTVRTPDLYTFQEPYNAHAETAPLATRSLVVDGVAVNTNIPWKLERQDASSASYSQELAIDQKPLLRLTRTYQLPQIEASKKQSQGYELNVTTTMQNLADHPLTIKALFNGPTVPPKEVERGADRQILMGYRNAEGIKASQHVVDEFRKDKITQDLTKNADNEVAQWGGAASVYFSAIILPLEDPSATKTGYHYSATDLDSSTDAGAHVAMTVETDDIKLAPQETATLPWSVFLGPKQRQLLDTPYYASMPRHYDTTLVITSGWCGICTLPWLINLLVMVLSAFHFVFRDWGIAIICLVAIVRILLHPITKRSQVHMMKMGKMGPEMERLKQKYGDDKDALNKAMMQYYKEQGLGPLLGCAPMFLQMPIWIALWAALQSTFELRHSPFLYFFGHHFTWIRDLANPDALVSWPPFSIFGFDIAGLNVLPLLLSVVFFLQQKYTPKPIATTPEQAQQQKMMMWMSTLMFPIFLYKGPAGLNLYILTSTTIGIIESKVIRDHIKQREEAEKAGKVIVDAKPTRGSKRRDDRQEPQKKPTGVMGWLAQLQARAEELRNQGDGSKPR